MSLLIFLSIQIIAVMAFPLWVAKHRQRVTVLMLYCVALVVLLLEVWILKTSVYGGIVLDDSAQYDRFARALAEHWSGNDVFVDRYDLPGFGADDAIWRADQKVPLAKLFQSAHFLYEAYLGAFYWLTNAETGHVALANSVFIAGVAPTMYVTAARLTDNESLARLAGILVIVDPTFAAVGAYVLKDGMAVLLFSVFLLVSVNVFSHQRGMNDLVLWVVLLTALSVIRIPAVFAVYAAFFSLMVVPRWRRAIGGGKAIFLGLACSLLFTGYLVRPDTYFTKMHMPCAYPQISIAMKPVGLCRTTVPDDKADAEKTGLSSAGHDVDDDDTDEERPPVAKILRIAKGFVYALAAPFPWVPLYKGLSLTYSDLFYPGIILWLIGLPLGAYYLLSTRGSHSAAMAFMVIVVVSIVAMYILTFDKFATRHRVFVLPVFWLLVSGGITTVREKYRRKRS